MWEEREKGKKRGQEKAGGRTGQGGAGGQGRRTDQRLIGLREGGKEGGTAVRRLPQADRRLEGLTNQRLPTRRSAPTSTPVASFTSVVVGPPRLAGTGHSGDLRGHSGELRGQWRG